MKNQSVCPNIPISKFIRKIAAVIPIYLLMTIIGSVHLSAEVSKQSISDAIKGFAENKKRMRIAVLDFVNTSGQKTQYDGYIADTIISELSKYSLTLLERKRLELLLKEHALSQSGIVDSEKALKMGMLLPVDVIVSGSYTQIGSKVIVNGRFIHVGSGEILYAFTASINTEAKLSAGKDTKPVCDPIWEPVVNALKNLKDKEAVNHAAKFAVSIPFDESECGKIHYKIMYTFSRYQKYPVKYNEFLLETLSLIDDPSHDNRTQEILEFLSADKTVDSKEWTVMLSTFKKIDENSWMKNRILLSRMLNNQYEKKNTVRKRIDEIMSLTKEKKIGRPVPVTEENMFFDILDCLNNVYPREDMSNQVYLFKKYQKVIPDTEEYNKKATPKLIDIYYTAHNRDLQKHALEQLIRFYRSREKTSFLASEIGLTVWDIERRSIDRYGHYEQNKDKKAHYKNDLKVLNTSLAELMCHSVTVRWSEVEYIKEYMLKNGIKCEHIPTIQNLEDDMRSGDWDKKLKAIELLSKIGIAAKPAEQTVIKYLGQQGFGRNGDRLRRFCALTLGNINTADPKGITLLIESLSTPDSNSEFGVIREAEKAIKKIGVTALPYLIKGLDHENRRVRYRCIEALANLGKKAEDAVEKLEEIAEKDEIPSIRQQAMEAIQWIKSDF